MAKAAAPRGNAKFLEDLDEISSELAKDLACDLVGDVLLPAEVADADAVDDASEAPSRDAYVNAATKALVAKGWTPASIGTVVNWGVWINGLIETAQRAENQTPAGTVTASSVTRSRAFYYYLKLCHAPPR